ncbi:hypothetical protein T12_2382 [Trichinella patagoniensis]|uniref:Uncharacterized protein n=1 Tax=Trichinella patagoniensis TaxID=990121 RepID=A0A0V0ZQD1_9BILA|nr:hypothetical protein T12_8429 [Trichinella patagoniensis]KRY17533.1 hypothetical protein T12_2382 [Trichinella patagoniensis]
MPFEVCCSMLFEEISKASEKCTEGKLANGSVTSEQKLALKAGPIVLQACKSIRHHVITSEAKLADRPALSEPKISGCLFICQTISVGIQQPSQK